MQGKRLEEVSLTDIIPNRFQPRIHFDEDKIESLAKSIIKYGVLEPIIVRPLNGKYEIIAGERRFKASKIAGKTTIPAIIVDYNDKESIELALLENVQRQELTAIEEAIAYRRILDMGYITQEQLAKKTGKSQPTIANKMRLLALDDETQEALINHKISERHARSLLKLSGTGKEIEMLHRIIKERLTVRKTDEEIAIILGEKQIPKKEKVNIEKTDEFFVAENEKTTNKGLNEKTIDKGPIYIAEKKEENKDFNKIESLFDETEIKENKGGISFMDIEKIMQEAQDINANEKPKDTTSFVSTPSPYANLINNEQEEPVNDINQTIDMNQNKFVYVKEREEPLKEEPKQEPAFNYENVFNFSPADPAPVVNTPAEKVEEMPSSIPSKPVEPAMSPVAPQTEASLSSNVLESNEESFAPTKNFVNNDIELPKTDEPVYQNFSAANASFSEDLNTNQNQISNNYNMNYTDDSVKADNTDIEALTPNNDTLIQNFDSPVVPEYSDNIKNDTIENSNDLSQQINIAVPDVTTVPVNNYENINVVQNVESNTVDSFTSDNDDNEPIPSEAIMVENNTSEETKNFVSPSNEQIPEFTSPIYDNANSVPEFNTEQPEVPAAENLNTSNVPPLNNSTAYVNPVEQTVSAITPTVNVNNFNEVVNIIRNCSKQIEALGYKINMDELDLGNNYQVILSIDK